MSDDAVGRIANLLLSLASGIGKTRWMASRFRFSTWNWRLVRMSRPLWSAAF